MAQDPKTYKAEEDPERAFYLMSFLNIARDFPRTASLASSFSRELHAMSLRQADRDEKENAANLKEAAAAAAKAAAETSESDESPPTRARGR